ncbi:MAG: hypothetical protein J5I93_22000 [Pirellulaceae bacterium]|nr:hypothetical protein [Pirellulaceae bacterium]
MILPRQVFGADPGRPPFSEIEAAVRQSFAGEGPRQANDIISRGQVARALKQVEQTGWIVPESEQLLRRVLADDDLLVRSLRTRDGRRLMSRVGGQRLMYDQLDRVAREPGGAALVRDLPRLPDAHLQAQHLEQFLPKIGSGRARRVPDFDRPTGHIYTVDQLLAALRELYQAGA